MYSHVPPFTLVGPLVPAQLLMSYYGVVALYPRDSFYPQPPPGASTR